MDISNYEIFNEYENIKEINLGWSGDKKYKARYKDKEVLIRISSIDQYHIRKLQYEQLKNLNKTHNINIPEVISFGMLDESYVYTTLTYLKGNDARDVILQYDEKKQYQLGIEAGKILKKINSTKISKQACSWHKRYINKINKKIEKSLDYKNLIPKYEVIIKYINENKDLTKNIRTHLCHTDYHLGNMIIYNDHIYIIDFDKMGYEDIYSEFKPFIWNVKISKAFQNGFIDGYFNHKIPDNFFNILALYAAESIISHIPWAYKFDKKEVLVALEVANLTLEYFDDFKKIKPTWYKDKTYV